MSIRVDGRPLEEFFRHREAHAVEHLLERGAGRAQAAVEGAPVHRQRLRDIGTGAPAMQQQGAQGPLHLLDAAWPRRSPAPSRGRVAGAAGRHPPPVGPASGRRTAGRRRPNRNAAAPGSTGDRARHRPAPNATRRPRQETSRHRTARAKCSPTPRARRRRAANSFRQTARRPRSRGRRRCPARTTKASAPSLLRWWLTTNSCSAAPTVGAWRTSSPSNPRSEVRHMRPSSRPMCGQRVRTAASFNRRSAPS